MRALRNWGLAVPGTIQSHKEITHPNYQEGVTKGYKAKHWNGEGRMWVKNHTEIMMTRKPGHCTC